MLEIKIRSFPVISLLFLVDGREAGGIKTKDDLDYKA
jgi:hypothetical protein